MQLFLHIVPSMYDHPHHLENVVDHDREQDQNPEKNAVKCEDFSALQAIAEIISVLIKAFAGWHLL